MRVAILVVAVTACAPPRQVVRERPDPEIHALSHDFAADRSGSQTGATAPGSPRQTSPTSPASPALPTSPTSPTSTASPPLASPPVLGARRQGPVVMHDPPLADLRALMPPIAPLELEPSLPAVHAAWPGICERRGRMPEAELAYVLAWCALPAGGPPGVIAALAPLVATQPAAQHDTVMLVAVTAPTVGDARRALARAPIDPIVARADLAAALLADGREREAREVAADLPPARRAACTLALRDALAEADRDLPDTLRAAAATECARAAAAVAAAIRAEPATPAARYARLLARWGDGDWFALAALAEDAMPLPGAEEAAITALANELRSACEPAVLSQVSAAAAHIAARADREPDARLDALLHALSTPALARSRCFRP